LDSEYRNIGLREVKRRRRVRHTNLTTATWEAHQLDDTMRIIPEMICGRDTDELFKFTTASSAVIKDARLGLAKLSLQ
jgi:hypothetical protein